MKVMNKNISRKNELCIFIICLCALLAIIDIIYLEDKQLGIYGRTQAFYLSSFSDTSSQKDSQHLKNIASTIRKLPTWQKFLCDTKKTNITSIPSSAIPLEDIDVNTSIKPSSNNVFLLETACNPRPSYRAWCAVESWAAQNSEARIWYVLSSPYVDDPIGLMKRLLAKYSNIKVITVDFSHVFEETPLKEFFLSMNWTVNTAWPEIQLSDLSRVVFVWKFGGYYSDTDTICINDTSGLHDVIGFQNDYEVTNGQFHAHPNHPFLHRVMEHIVKSFDPGYWGSLGPKLFTAVAAMVCGAPISLKRGQEPQKCSNMTFIPPDAFFPVYWENFKSLLENNHGKDLKKTFNNSITIHFYNKLMQNEAIRVGAESVYDVAARMYCPITYRHLSSHSKFF